MENTVNITKKPNNDFTLDVKKENQKSKILSIIYKVFIYAHKVLQDTQWCV